MPKKRKNNKIVSDSSPPFKLDFYEILSQCKIMSRELDKGTARLSKIGHLQPEAKEWLDYSTSQIHHHLDTKPFNMELLQNITFMVEIVGIMIDGSSGADYDSEVWQYIYPISDSSTNLITETMVDVKSYEISPAQILTDKVSIPLELNELAASSTFTPFKLNMPAILSIDSACNSDFGQSPLSEFPSKILIIANMLRAGCFTLSENYSTIKNYIEPFIESLLKLGYELEDVRAYIAFKICDSFGITSSHTEQYILYSIRTMFSSNSPSSPLDNISTAAASPSTTSILSPHAAVFVPSLAISTPQNVTTVEEEVMEETPSKIPFTPPVSPTSIAISLSPPQQVQDSTQSDLWEWRKKEKKKYTYSPPTFIQDCLKSVPTKKKRRKKKIPVSYPCPSSPTSSVHHPSHQAVIQAAWWEGWKEDSFPSASPYSTSTPMAICGVYPSHQATITDAWWEGWKLSFSKHSRQIFIKCILTMLFILLFVMNSTSYSTLGRKGLKVASTETYTIPPVVVSIDSPSPLPFYIEVLPIPTAAIHYHQSISNSCWSWYSFKDSLFFSSSYKESSLLSPLRISSSYSSKSSSSFTSSTGGLPVVGDRISYSLARMAVLRDPIRGHDPG
jgi:hypothetical protein